MRRLVPRSGKSINDSANTIADDTTQINAVATELPGSCRTTQGQMDVLKVTDNQSVWFATSRACLQVSLLLHSARRVGCGPMLCDGVGSCAECHSSLWGLACRYCAITPADLDDSNDCLAPAMKDRLTSFERETSRVAENDRVSKEFASEADPLVTEVNDSMCTLVDAKKDLENQLSYVDTRLSWVSGTASTALAKIEGSRLQLQSRMVMSVQRVHDAGSVGRPAAVLILQGISREKQPAIEADIEHTLHKGVS
jgi:hypothetical protein